MKRVLKLNVLFLFYIIFINSGFSQCENVNGNIESYQNSLPSSSATNHNNFINNDLNNWYVGYNTPNVYTGSTAPWSMGGSGNLLYMQSHNSNKPESVYTNYQFVAGKQYTLTYKLWRNTDAHSTATFEVLLATGLQPNFGGAFQTPTTSQNVVSKPWTDGPLGSWVTVSKTFVATANFDQLFFYPKSIPWDVYARAAIDNICITEVPQPCAIESEMTVLAPFNGCVWKFYNISQVSSNPALQSLQTTWSFGDGSVGSGDFASHQYTTPGNYLVCMTTWMTDGISCCKSTVCERVNVNSVCDNDPCSIIESAKFNISGTGPITVTEVGTPSSMSSTLGYYWDFGDGNFASGKVASHSYNQQGTFTIVLTVFYADEKGNCCSVKVIKEVTIDSTESGKREISEVSIESSVLMDKDLKFVVKPNPSNGVFEISSPKFVEKMMIVDLSGKVVYEQNVNSNVPLNESMNLKFLKNGMYIIVLTQVDSQESIYQKIIIE